MTFVHSGCRNCSSLQIARARTRLSTLLVISRQNTRYDSVRRTVNLRSQNWKRIDFAYESRPIITMISYSRPCNAGVDRAAVLLSPRRKSGRARLLVAEIIGWQMGRESRPNDKSKLQIPAREAKLRCDLPTPTASTGRNTSLSDQPPLLPPSLSLSLSLSLCPPPPSPPFPSSRTVKSFELSREPSA